MRTKWEEKTEEVKKYIHVRTEEDKRNEQNRSGDGDRSPGQKEKTERVSR